MFVYINFFAGFNLSLKNRVFVSACIRCAFLFYMKPAVTI
ncbi:hypothetical protein J520_0027 [Acinetobacter sp. 869535]|nr:hypothetical protein J520_0027 [Acinetobacter sp. 869535]